MAVAEVALPFSRREAPGRSWVAASPPKRSLPTLAEGESPHERRG